MKSITKSSATLLLFYALFFSSCAAFRTLDMTKLSLGMDKETAYKTLQLKPDNVVVVKQYPTGTLEVVEYGTTVAAPVSATGANATPAQRPERFWLYFFNNKLVQYGRAGNLQEEEEHIVSMQGK